MTLDPNKIAERLGATAIAQMPGVIGGAFGMAQLAEQLKQRLDARGRRKPGTATGWILNSKVPISAETERQLIALAETGGEHTEYRQRAIGITDGRGFARVWLGKFLTFSRGQHVP